MDLLDIPIPTTGLQLDLPTATFFERCEVIGEAKGWIVDRRKPGAGHAFDQLNLYLGTGERKYPMLRMVVRKSASRIELDIVTDWKTSPVAYDEYLSAIKAGFGELLRSYASVHARRFRITPPRRPAVLDMTTVDCGKIAYAVEKLQGITRSLALGPGDARRRLINAFWTIHVLRPEDFPSPLREHWGWVFDRITKRPPRHRMEGGVESTVVQMKNATLRRCSSALLI